MERLAEAWGNVMDGRHIAGHVTRISPDMTTAEDWRNIADEYAALGTGEGSAMEFPDVTNLGTVDVQAVGRFAILMVREGYGDGPGRDRLVDIIEQAIFETDTGLEAALLAADRIVAALGAAQEKGETGS